MRWWVGDGVDLASPALAIQLRRAGEVFLPTLDFCLFVKACVGSNPVAYPVSEIEERALGWRRCSEVTPVSPSAPF